MSSILILYRFSWSSVPPILHAHFPVFDYMVNTLSYFVQQSLNFRFECHLESLSTQKKIRFVAISSEAPCNVLCVCIFPNCTIIRPHSVRILTRLWYERCRVWSQVRHATGRPSDYTVMHRLTTGYILRNASLGDFVVVRTSYSVLTQTQIVQYSLLHT